MKDAFIIVQAVLIRDYHDDNTSDLSTSHKCCGMPRSLASYVSRWVRS